MNKLEMQAKSYYEKEGWTVLRNGWPDFLIYKEKGDKFEIKGVEVKSEGKYLSPNQRKLHNILLKLITIEIYTQKTTSLVDELKELLRLIS